MDVEGKAVISIWKDGIPCFASYLVKPLKTERSDQVTIECVALAKTLEN